MFLYSENVYVSINMDLLVLEGPQNKVSTGHGQQNSTDRAGPNAQLGSLCMSLEDICTERQLVSIY